MGGGLPCRCVLKLIQMWFSWFTVNSKSSGNQTCISHVLNCKLNSPNFWLQTAIFSSNYILRWAKRCTFGLFLRPPIPHQNPVKSGVQIYIDTDHTVLSLVDVTHLLSRLSPGIPQPHKTHCRCPMPSPKAPLPLNHVSRWETSLLGSFMLRRPFCWFFFGKTSETFCGNTQFETNATQKWRQ